MFKDPLHWFPSILFRNLARHSHYAGTGNQRHPLPDKVEEQALVQAFRDKYHSMPPAGGGLRLSYGPDPNQFGELRLPTNEEQAPVVVVIHGGFWRSAYDLDHIGYLCAAITGLGAATWSLEYRRVGNPGGGWTGTFLDVAAALDFLRTLAREYPLDTRRVVTLGHSAGGQLALWAAGRPRLAPGSPLYCDNPLFVQGAVSLAGVNDLAQGWRLGLSNHAVAELMGGSPAEHPIRYACASPVELLPLGVPQSLVHGRQDEVVPFDLSEAYARHAQAAGDPVRLLPLEGMGHFAPIDPRSPAWPTVAQAVLQAIGGQPGVG